MKVHPRRLGCLLLIRAPEPVQHHGEYTVWSDGVAVFLGSLCVVLQIKYWGIAIAISLVLNHDVSVIHCKRF